MKKFSFLLSILTFLLLLSSNSVFASEDIRPVWRLYSPVTHEHLYTMDDNERASLASNGWNDEDSAFLDFSNIEGFDFLVPVYRLNNDSTKRHLYTSDTNEIEVLKQQGWTVDGNGRGCFYYDPNSGVPVYRLFNQAEGLHLLTADGGEYNTLGSAGWIQEGQKFNCYLN